MVNQIAENWLDKAGEDLAFAKASLQEDLEFYPQICFYKFYETIKLLNPRNGNQ